MMNRKADLSNNVIGIIIAALGLAFLVYASVKLYSANVNQEDENAKRTLDLVMSHIERLEDGQSANKALQGFDGSEDWYFVGWNNDSRSRPEKCFFGNCLCVCRDSASVEKCDGAHGFCRDLKNYNISVEGEFALNSYYEGSGDYERDEYYLTGSNPVGVSCIPLGGSLFEIQVSKKSNGVFVYRSFLDEGIDTLPSCG